MNGEPRRAHRLTLVAAIGAALDRVEYHLERQDDPMASVFGAVVRRLLAHSCAMFYASGPEWAAMLVRWGELEPRLGPASLDLSDIVDHHANVLLIDATRAADREAAA